jgi:RNA polymerase sigma-70 factor, ECF subfamily
VTPQRENKDTSDEALVRLFQQGDATAFRVLVTRHKTPLYNFALRQLRSPTLAEDIVQDAFVRVVQSVAEFKHESKFTTWVYAIVRNLCIDQARKNALRRHPSLEQKTSSSGGDGDQGPSLGEQLADGRPNADVERSAISTELRSRLLLAVEELPFKEIAEITGVPENTVKSRMRYALERLQEALSEYQVHAQTLP